MRNKFFGAAAMATFLMTSAQAADALEPLSVAVPVGAAVEDAYEDIVDASDRMCTNSDDVGMERFARSDARKAYQAERMYQSCMDLVVGQAVRQSGRDDLMDLHRAMPRGRPTPKPEFRTVAMQ